MSPEGWREGWGRENRGEALDVVVWNKQYFFLLYWSACFLVISQGRI
jgi:hypothetical protein